VRNAVLNRLARLAIAAPGLIVAVAVLFAVGAGWYGSSVTKNLSAGGLQDPAAESSRAGRLLADKFGQGDLQLIFMITAEGGVHSAAARTVATDIVERLHHESPYRDAPAFVSGRNRRCGKRSRIKHWPRERDRGR
jgi:hypothetical protein